MAAPIQTCYRHTDRRAGVTCQRCDRPICPQCMNQASVGFHCPECTRSGRQRVYTAKTLIGQGSPIVTQVLIAANVLVFLLGAASGGRAGIVFDGRNNFLLDGGLNAFAISKDGEWYRIVTSGFLHFGAFHLLFNMWALYVLGSQLERAVGKLRFSIVYLVALIGGSLGGLILTPDALSAGASGAVFGLLGLALAAQRAQGINIWESGLGGVLFLNLLITFSISNISIGGHLGGLVAGYLCGVFLYEVGPRTRNQVAPVVFSLCLGVVLFMGCLVAAGVNA